MGKWPDFEYHLGKLLKHDRSSYNSSHPSLGSPLDLGNPWRPLATIGDMLENDHFGHFQAIIHNLATIGTVAGVSDNFLIF